MSELKLAKLPDRKPVKIAITVSPNLNKKLDAYADAYKGAYGDEEKVSDLIPFMLEQFLDGNRLFKGRRRVGIWGSSHRGRIDMAVIGAFCRAKDGGWQGTIRTLSNTLKARFVPNDDRRSDTAPDFSHCISAMRLGSRLGTQES